MGLFGLMLGGAVAGKVAGNTLHKKQMRQARNEESLETLTEFFVSVRDKKERSKKIIVLNEQLTKIGARRLPEDASEEKVQWTEYQLEALTRTDIREYRDYQDRIVRELHNYYGDAQFWSTIESRSFNQDFESYKQKVISKAQYRYENVSELFDLDAGAKMAIERFYKEEGEETWKASHRNHNRNSYGEDLSNIRWFWETNGK